MTAGRFALGVPTVLALLLAACGSGGDEAPYCPAPFTVQDAGRLTHFRDGPGRDPRDIEYEAVLAAAGTKCTASRNQIEVTLIMRISVAAGPSVVTGPTRVPYFVRVLDGSNSVAQSQEFTADFRLTANNPRATSQEELTLRLPYGRDTGGYRIAVGLKPTPEELNYNRRGRQ